MTKTATEIVTQYLQDIHALEEQSLQQLRSAPDNAGEPGLEGVLREHLAETETHERRIRELLDMRGAGVSRIKDAVMRAGGEGFVLFARAQQDTPGKLCAHSLSYEALEWAAHSLLERLALEAGEPNVATTARAIRQNEAEMMQRIDALFDDTTTASLHLRGSGDLDDALRTYLREAHAIEAQAIQLLESGRGMMEGSTWSTLMERHLDEERMHQESLESCLQSMDGNPSSLEDAALRLAGFNWSMFFRAQPDSMARFAAFVFALQYLEIGGYEQLWRVAERARRPEIVDPIREILRQEREAASKFANGFDGPVSADLGF